MSARSLRQAFTIGAIVGAAIMFLAVIAYRLWWMGSETIFVTTHEETLPCSIVWDSPVGSPPSISMEFDAAIDALGAWSTDTLEDSRSEIHFGAERYDARPGVVAFAAWEGNGFTGYSAFFRFGPDPRDLHMQVRSFGDMGGPGHPWSSVTGVVRLSTWPLDVPGALVEFDLRGVVGARRLSFVGKMHVP